MKVNGTYSTVQCIRHQLQVFSAYFLRTVRTLFSKRKVCKVPTYHVRKLQYYILLCKSYYLATAVLVDLFQFPFSHSGSRARTPASHRSKNQKSKHYIISENKLRTCTVLVIRYPDRYHIPQQRNNQQPRNSCWHTAKFKHNTNSKSWRLRCCLPVVP